MFSCSWLSYCYYCCYQSITCSSCVTGGGTVCINTTLTASNGSDGTIYYQGTTSGGTSTGTPSSSQFITTSGTYYFRAQSAAGCWGPEGSQTVVINTPPVTTGVTICAGSSGTLTSSTTCSDGSPITTALTDAGTGANVNGPGTGGSWTNTNNITTTGNATVLISTNGTSEYLQGTNYGFTNLIPANATILGFQVSINRSSSANTGGNSINDVTLSLIKNGTIVTGTGSNKATATDWPTTLGVANYGTTSDLWGTTWTASDVRNTNFGVTLSVLNQSGVGTRTASVDYIKVAVTYSIPGSTDWYTASSGGTFMGSGTSFDPVGKPGGLNDTNTPNTYTYYAVCSTSTLNTCRTATDFVINPLPAAPVAGSNSYPYDGTLKTATADVKAGETIDWYTAPTGGSSTVAPSATNAGTYIAYAEARNLTTGCVSSGRTLITLAIDKALMTVTANDGIKPYGTLMTYTGSEFTTTGTFYNGDNITSVSLSSTGDPVTAAASTYPIVPGAAIGTGVDNYTITYTAGTLTVDKALVTVIADDASKPYGSLMTYSGTEFTTTGTFYNGDNITSVSLSSTGDPVTAAAGTYPIVPVTAVGTGVDNYTIIYTNGTLTVDKASVTVIANDGTKAYGSLMTYTGSEFTTTGTFYNGDNITSVSLSSTGDPVTATVNTYPIVPGAAVGTGVDNYDITYTNGTLTVEKALVTVIANDGIKPYGTLMTYTGSEFTTTGTFYNGDNITSVSLSSTGDPVTAAVNTYPIVPGAAIGTGVDNYTITYTAGTLTVDKALVTVIADDASKPYGSLMTYSGTEFTTTGTFYNGDNITSVSLSSTGDPVTAAAGTYPIVPVTAVGTGVDNYTIIYTNGTLTVDKASVTVIANDGTKAYGSLMTYTGSEFTTTGTFYNGDNITSVSLSSTGDPVTATVNTYPIVPAAAIGTGVDNYDITYTNGTLTVNPIALTITATDRTKNYGETVVFAGTEFTTSGLVNSDGVTSVTLTSDGAAATATIAGSPYDIVPTAALGSGLDNYIIGYVNGTMTVNPIALTITANSMTKNYGDVVTFAGTEYTTAGLVNGDQVTSVTLTSAGAVGTASVTGSPYPIVPSTALGSGLGNYTIGYINGTLTVDPIALTITADSRTKNYGETVVFAGTEFTTAGLINGDQVIGVTLTSDGAAATATVTGGPYDIVPTAASGSGLGNYTIGYSNGTLTVNPIALTVTATDRTKNYGETVVFAGTEFTTAGLINGDQVTSVTLTSDGAAATATVAGGPYDIVPTAASGSGLGNYTIGYVNGSLTVNPIALTITADSRTKNYGDVVTFAGTEFTTAGLVNGDQVTSVTLISAGAAASATIAGSPYDIVPTAALGSGLDNYTIGYVNGTLTVNPIALTITADSRTKNYGDVVTFAGTEFTTAGLVNGDQVTSVTLTSAGAVGTAPVTGSPYPIVPSTALGSGLGNYTIGYVNGTLTVNPIALTITANSMTKNYGDVVTFAGTEFTTAGLINGDAVTSVTLTSAGAAATATVTGSPYPIVPSTALGNGLGNYTIGYVNGTLTVNPIALTITANSMTKNYGDVVTFAGTEFTTTGLVNSDAVTSVTLTSAGAAATATVAGSPYPIVPSAALGSGLGNYIIGYVNGTLTVNPIALTITANSMTKNYGDVVIFAGTEFTTTGLVNGDQVTSVTLTSAGAVGTAMVTGSPYPIVPSTALGSGLGNYTIGYINGTLTVDPIALTITADSRTKNYGETVVFAGTEFTTAGLINGDQVTGVTLTSAGAAGTAMVTGSPYPIVPSTALGSGLGNYTIGYVNGTLTVNPIALTVTATDRTKNYGETVVFAGTEFTTAGLINGDQVTSVTLTSDGAAATATVAGGPYDIVPTAASGSGLGNYTIGYVNGTLTVNPIALTITADSRTKNYGDVVTFAGTEFTTAGLVNGDQVTSVTLISAGAAASATIAGSPYDIVPTAALGSGLDNYTIGYVNGTLTVNPIALTITADSRTKNYGDVVTFAGTEFTTAGLVNGDQVTSVTLTSAGAAATATVTGSPYPIVPSTALGSGLGNYTIGYVNGTLTVDPIALTITANSMTKNYGDVVTFAGTEFTTAGLINGDAVTSVTLTSAGAAATATVTGSPYPIVPSTALGNGLGNYTIGYVNGTLTVNPIALTITANSMTKNYGDVVTFAGTEFTTTGLVNSDAVTSVTLTSAGAAATATVTGSPYPIVPSTALGSGLGNYIISYVNGTLTVNPIALTITANSMTKNYGDVVIFAGTEFTTTGLVNGDEVTSVTLTSAGAAATATVTGSPYPIVPSTALGSGLANYTIGYVNGTLTVNPIALTITANSRTKNYGDVVTFAGTEFTTAGLINGDAVTSVTLTSAGAAATATVTGSPYPIVPSTALGSGLGNYTIGYVNGTLTVNPIALTITASNRTKTYGDDIIFAGTEFTTAGLINGDAVTSVTLISAGAAPTATVAGSPYPIVPSLALGSGLGNYTIGYVNGTLNVVPAGLTITANNVTKVYGSLMSYTGAEFTSAGLVNGDAITSVTLTSTGDPVTATIGTYPIVVSAATGTGLDNYTINYVNGTLTVTPKALTITASDLTKTYGDVVTFAGTEFTTPAGALVNGDAVTSATITSAGAPAAAVVGAYPIVISAAVGTGLANYAISYVAGTLTVSPHALTITATDQTKIYGELFTFAGTEFTSEGLVNGNTITSVTLASTGAAAAATPGAYPIVPSAAIGTGLGNYTITYVNGSLTVNPKAIAITASNRTKIYGDVVTFAGTEFTIPAGALVNGDAVTSVTLTSTGSAATATVAGSPYPIVASAAVGTGLSNYTISYINGSLTVTQRVLTVGGTFTVNNKVYDGTNSATFAVNNLTLLTLVGSDNVTLNATPVFADKVVGTGKPVSLTGLSIAGPDASNYTLSLVGMPTSAANITARVLTIGGTFTANNKAYDGTTAAIIANNNLTLVTPVDGDAVILNAVATFSDKVIGTNKIVSLTGSTLTGADAINYNLSFTGAPITTANITAKVLTIGGSFTAGNKVYDATTDATISTNNLTLQTKEGTDDVSLVAIASFADKFVGTGKIVSLTGSSLTGTDASNYILSLMGAPTATADITARELTIGGTFTANNKVYDGTTYATIVLNNLTLLTVAGSDNVTLTAMAAFSDPSVGLNKVVSLDRFIAFR